MEPTPVGRALADAIQAVVKIYKERLQHASRFEASYLPRAPSAFAPRILDTC